MAKGAPKGAKTGNRMPTRRRLRTDLDLRAIMNSLLTEGDNARVFQIIQNMADIAEGIAHSLDGKTPTFSEQVLAAKFLFDRLYGKPRDMDEVKRTTAPPITFQLEVDE